MNITTINQTQRFRRNYTTDSGTVLDIGSCNVSGRTSGRDLWPGWNYFGVDIQAGRNVDAVVDTEDFELCTRFDVVTSQNTFEHTQRPWRVFESAARHVKPGGFLFIGTPWVFPYHPFPIDAWRLSPDAYRVLCADNRLEVVETYIHRVGLLEQRSIAGLVLTFYQNFIQRTAECESFLIARRPG